MHPLNTMQKHYQEGQESMAVYSTSEDGSKEKKPVETSLRIVCAIFSASAMAVMIKSKQADELTTYEYTKFPAFEYLVYASGLCAAYSLISAIESLISGMCGGLLSWIILFLDQGFTFLMLSAGAAATEVLYLAYKGNKKATWSAVCQTGAGKFCHKTTASVIIAFCALVCLVAISIMSSYRVFSKYDPPLQKPKNQRALSS